MAIIGGSDSGKVGCAQSVLDRAEKTGLKLDTDGNLIAAE